MPAPLLGGKADRMEWVKRGQFEKCVGKCRRQQAPLSASYFGPEICTTAWLGFLLCPLSAL